MHTPFGRFRCALSIVLLCLTVSLLSADLSVNLPPGSPLDSSLQRRSPWPHLAFSPDDNLKQPDAEEGSAEAQTRITQQSWLDDIAVSQRYNLNADPFVSAFIATPDAKKHVLWMSAKDLGLPMSLGLKLLVQGEYLRVHLHGPKFISNGVEIDEDDDADSETPPDAEDFVQLLMKVHVPDTVHHLLDIGEPALFVAMDKRIEGRHLKRVADIIRDCVGPPAGPLPEPKVGATALATEYNRLLLFELGHRYQYEHDPGFGSRIAAEGEAILPALIAAAKSHPHKLVRRNAVTVLGAFGDSPDIRIALREIAKGEDLVAATRALLALSRRQDKAIVPWLLKRLQAKDPYHKNPVFQHLAAYCLGVIADPRAEAELVAWAQRAIRTRNTGGSLADEVPFRETLWSSLQALIRLQAHTKETKTLYTFIQGMSFDSVGPMKDFLLLAQYSAGVPNAIDQMKKRWKKETYPLQSFHTAVHVVMLDLLTIDPSRLHTQMLLRVTQSGRHPLSLRYESFMRWRPTAKDSKLLTSWIQDPHLPPVLRSVALIHLSQLDAAIAKKTAALFVKLYATRYLSLQPGSGYDVITAVRLLQTDDSLDTQALIELTELGLQSFPPPTPESAAKGLLVTSRAPLAKACMHALAAKNTDAAIAFLLQTLHPAIEVEEPDSPEADTAPMLSYRGQAAQALGWSHNVQVAGKLCQQLSVETQRDVRYDIAKALQTLSGKKDNTDWLMGDDIALQHGREFWQGWWDKRMEEQE